jgi:hypothetical protein
MNAFATICLSLENANLYTTGKTFVLYKTDNEPLAYVSFNHNDEMANNYYHSNVTSLIGFNIKCETDKVIELTPESFIREVNIRTGHYNYKTAKYEDDSIGLLGIKLPIVTSFDTSAWNEIFATKFDNSWSNVCKYVYYNKAQMKYGLKNRTFRQDGNRCVPTKDGVLFSLSNETKFDMNYTCTVHGIPIAWIVMNWMKVGRSTPKKSVMSPALRDLFERIQKASKSTYFNSGIKFYAIEEDSESMKRYSVYKSYVLDNSSGKRLDNDQIQKLLDNPNLWCTSRWESTLRKAPLLTNKDTE